MKWDGLKTPTELVYLLAESLGQGANLLLNFGPKGDGSFPDQALPQLAGLGRFCDATPRRSTARPAPTGSSSTCASAT